jgi:hypothetical protein
MIHIVFNEVEVPLLKSVMELETTLEGTVVQIKDDYAVGPLTNIYEPEGIEGRKNWWRMVLEGGDSGASVDNGNVDDEAVVASLINQLQENPEEVLWIWCAQNKHDVSGYYWLMSKLKEWQGRVYILYLNNLPFINEKGQLFYPEWLSQIRPSEFIKAQKLARLITLSEFEVDPDEWTKICNEEKGIRLLEGGKKLVQEGIDFYDTELKSYITNDFQKAAKIINTYLNKSKNLTGDSFLLWRLKKIVENGDYSIQGSMGKMKDFEVKKASGTAVEG